MPTPAFAPKPDQHLAQAIRRCLGLSLSGALLTMPLAALAQENAASASETDTVVVVGTALKVDTPILETPRATSLVTNEDIQKRNVTKMDEAFQYRSGVVSQPYGSDNNADWMFLRGFSAEGSTYQDGLRLFRTGGYFWWMTEPFGLERVELLKGPASILYGEAPPGGVINAISKRPTEEKQGLFEIQAGNHDHRQIGVDVSGPITGRDDMQYRIVSMYREQDSELDGTYKERYYFAPSLAVELSDDTSVTFLASIQKDEGVPTTGFFPAYGTLEDTPYGKIEPNTNLGQPDYDNIDQRQVSLGYEIELHLNEVWEFKQNFRYSKLDLELRTVYPNWAEVRPRSVSRGVVDRDGKYDAFTLDNRLVTTTYTTSTENTLLLGVDYQKLALEYDNADSFRTLGNGSAYFTMVDTIDMFSPDHGSFTSPDISAPTNHKVDKEQVGLYVQDHLRLNENWIFLAGARYDNAEINDNFSDNAGSFDEGYDENQLSMTGGIMYLADNGLSPYISYSESFTPLASTGPSGKSYKPLEGQQFEVGVKYVPADFDGYLTAAVFDIKESNTLAYTGLAEQEQVGERNSTGVEIEGVGYLTDNLQLTASYTYTDARIDVSESQQDERAPFIPYHMASAWLDYDFNSGVLDGLSIGGGVRYVGETAGSSDPYAPEIGNIPSYTLYDAMARYDLGAHWTAQLNINNISDEDYVSGCGFYCYYGESRRIVGSLSYRW